MRIGLSVREPLFGEALACLLESRRGWSTAFVASSVEEALERHRAASVRLLLVDGAGMKARAMDALVQIQRTGGASVVLLVADPETAPCRDLPGDHVLSRRASADAMFAALDGILRRPGRARANPSPFDLSRRELECAQLVARGLSNRHIAELTGIREQSVKNVVSLAMRKLGAENRVQVALRLSQIGVADSLPTRAVVALPVGEAVGV